ncbi:exported hypothetical protein [Phycicoccus elongatus Lp2]|uniref:Uncharacterized protein n=1 Tax=Phycicoccus elongatus Lp2 TaxID=1193181 RepID=N0E602_9MICO|nr:exported hypothetical protein [Phycicoccus elongatus Lp2]
MCGSMSSSSVTRRRRSSSGVAALGCARSARTPGRASSGCWVTASTSTCTSRSPRIGSAIRNSCSAWASDAGGRWGRLLAPRTHMWHPAARQTLIRSHSLTHSLTHSLAHPTQVSRPSTPTIDVYAASCTFADTDQLAVDLATTVMTIEQVPNIPMSARTRQPSCTSSPRRLWPTSTATRPTCGCRC